MRKGLKTLFKAVAGKDSLSAELVTNHKYIACPPVDTIFLNFHRDGENDTLICLRPDEACIISELLRDVVFAQVKNKPV